LWIYFFVITLTLNNFVLIGLLACIVILGILCHHLYQSVRQVGKRSLTPAIPKDLRFGDLEGEALWMVFNGTLPLPNDSAALIDLQAWFEPVAQRHMEEVFNEALLDSKLNVNIPPPSLRLIKTQEGQLLSWLPDEVLNIVYRIGLHHAGNNISTDLALCNELDAAAENIYNILNLPFKSLVQALGLKTTEPSASLATDNPDQKLNEIAPLTNPEASEELTPSIAQTTPTDTMPSPQSPKTEK
jgi:hypothetical protein